MVVNGVLSGVLPVIIGVPQGLFLGSFPFFLFINYLMFISVGKSVLFAGGSVCNVQGDTLESSALKVDHIISHLSF